MRRVADVREQLQSAVALWYLRRRENPRQSTATTALPRRRKKRQRRRRGDVKSGHGAAAEHPRRTQVPTQEYAPGQVIDVAWCVAADHGGVPMFRLCNDQSLVDKLLDANREPRRACRDAAAWLD